MRRREGEDVQGAALLAVIVIGAAVVAYGASVLPGVASAPGALPGAVVGQLPWIALAVLAAGGVLVWREVATRRTLATRRRLLVLASEEFDPSLDAVGRFASQLAHLRPGIGGWLDRRARAVRVLLEPDPSGRLAYVLEVAARDLPLVRTAIGVYGEVDLVDLDEPPAPEEPQGAAVRTQLVLARSASEPLGQLGLDPDPLQSFAAALDGARVEHGDRIQVAVDLMPSGPGRRRRLQRRLLKQTRRDPQPRLSDVLMGRERSAGGGLVEPGELVERRSELRGLDQKFGHGELLLAVQILIRCRSRSRGQARLLMQGAMSCFDAFAGMNHLRARGLRLPGGFLGTDLPGARKRFDRRLDDGLFRPHRRGLVTPSEIGGLLKPPTSGSQALRRAETVALVIGGARVELRRPTLLGAILLKARSLMVHGRPEDQRADLITLLGLLTDPRAAVNELTARERAWLRAIEDKLDLADRDLDATVDATRLRIARAAYARLI